MGLKFYQGRETDLFLNSFGSFLEFSHQLIYSLVITLAQARVLLSNKYINCYENSRNQRKEPKLIRNRSVSLLWQNSAATAPVFLIFLSFSYIHQQRVLLLTCLCLRQPLCQFNKVFIMMAPPVLGRTCWQIKFSKFPNFREFAGNYADSDWAM